MWTGHKTKDVHVIGSRSSICMRCRPFHHIYLLRGAERNIETRNGDVLQLRSLCKRFPILVRFIRKTGTRSIALCRQYCVHCAIATYPLYCTILHPLFTPLHNRAQ